MDIRRNADRLTLIYTFKIRFWAMIRRPTAVQARSHLNTQLPNADTIDFFCGPRKRGVRPHPPNPPWLRACTGALARLKPELKRTHVENNVPRKLTVTATIFPPPIKAQIVSKGESQGRHLDTGGGFTRKHARRGPNGQLPCILDRQRRLPRTLSDHVRSASALSALKKRFGRQPVR